MGTLCMQLLLQIYTDQVENLQALLLRSVDVQGFAIIVSFIFVTFFDFRT